MATNLIISTPSELWRIPVGDIMHINAEGNYSRLHFGNGESELITQQLGKIEELIGRQVTTDESTLVRIGKSSIINRIYVYHITKNEVLLRSASGKIFTVNAAREALVQLKKLMEGEKI